MATSDYDAQSPSAQVPNAQLPLEVQVPPRLLTAADLAVMPTELPSGNVDYELDNGRIVMMSPPADRHGEIQLRIGTELVVQGDKLGHGKSRTEASVVLWKGPDRVVVPDVLFISQASLPLRHSSEGYLETIPDLVIEIRSKNDSVPYLERKIADYLKAGVKQAWVVDPATRTIQIYRPEAEVQTFQHADVIAAQEFPLIPDFRLVLAEVFAE